VSEGRFIDVNEAFERRYGYSRDEILGRTVFDIGVWADPTDRPHMLSEIREQGRIRNRATRLRKRFGDIIDTIYSADVVELDGQQCLLVVSEDLPDRADLQTSLAQKPAVAR
jgi:PAS domain S-box-containing protein